MNTQEHLLTIVAEECAEVAQRATKALRFGPEEVQPGSIDGLTNAQRLMEELDDLMGTITLMTYHGLLPGLNTTRQRAKMNRIIEFLKYSGEQGTHTSTMNLHPKRFAGQCPICGQYGDDCTGKMKSEV